MSGVEVSGSDPAIFRVCTALDSRDSARHLAHDRLRFYDVVALVFSKSEHCQNLVRTRRPSSEFPREAVARSLRASARYVSRSVIKSLIGVR